VSECKGSVHPEKGQSNCSEFANVLNVQELSLNCPSSGANRGRLFRCGTSNYYYSVAKYTLMAQPIYQYAPCRLPICNERECAATKIISNSFLSSFALLVQVRESISLSVQMQRQLRAYWYTPQCQPSWATDIFMSLQRLVYAAKVMKESTLTSNCFFGS
jgi:hypothetical protein